MECKWPSPAETTQVHASGWGNLNTIRKLMSTFQGLGESASGVNVGSFSLFFFFFQIILYVWIFCLHMYLCTNGPVVPLRAIRGSPGIGHI